VFYVAKEKCFLEAWAKSSFILRSVSNISDKSVVDDPPDEYGLDMFAQVGIHSITMEAGDGIVMQADLLHRIKGTFFMQLFYPEVNATPGKTTISPTLAKPHINYASKFRASHLNLSIWEYDEIVEQRSREDDTNKQSQGQGDEADEEEDQEDGADEDNQPQGQGDETDEVEDQEDVADEDNQPQGQGDEADEEEDQESGGPWDDEENKEDTSNISSDAPQSNASKSQDAPQSQAVSNRGNRTRAMKNADVGKNKPIWSDDDIDGIVLPRLQEDKNCSLTRIAGAINKNAPVIIPLTLQDFDLKKSRSLQRLEYCSLISPALLDFSNFLRIIGPKFIVDWELKRELQENPLVIFRLNCKSARKMWLTTSCLSQPQMEPAIELSVENAVEFLSYIDNKVVTTSVLTRASIIYLFFQVVMYMALALAMNATSVHVNGQRKGKSRALQEIFEEVDRFRFSANYDKKEKAAQRELLLLLDSKGWTKVMSNGEMREYKFPKKICFIRKLVEVFRGHPELN
jgi:hypothetical protein